MNKEVIAQFLHSVDANSNGDNSNDNNDSNTGSGSGSGSNNYYNRQQDDLVEAYRQAGKYRDLRHFIRNRFKDEDRLEDFNREVELNGDLMPNEDPFVTKLDPSTGSRHDLRKSSTSGSSSSTRGKKGGRRSSNSNSNSPAVDTSSNNANSPKGITVGEKSNIVDRDDGANNDNDGIVTAEEAKLDKEELEALAKKRHSIHRHTELADGIDSESVRPTKKQKTRGGKLDRTRRIEISLLFRRRIQKNLIQRDTPPTTEDIKETHKLLNKIYENLDNDPPFFDIDALRQSKLHKLLKVISNTPELEEFHPICKDILIHWADMIQVLKLEKMKAREQVKAQGEGSVEKEGQQDIDQPRQ